VTYKLADPWLNPWVGREEHKMATELDSRVFEDQELVRQLAVLKDAGHDAIRARIALMPLETRTLLAAEGVINRGPDAEAVKTLGRSTKFDLTDRGMEIIQECAERAAEPVSPEEAATA
jgi:hypothetical protein